MTAQLQKDSDTKLKKAESLVKAALTQLGQKTGDAHAVHAAKLLTHAVTEIESALHVVRHYHKHQQQAVAALKK